MLKAALRLALRGLCALPVPGRYVLLGALGPMVAPSGPVAARVGRSMTMQCDLRDEVQQGIYYGLYEPTESRLFPTLLREGDVFLDVGANVGYYTLWAAELVGRSGRVHAFEPIAENCARLRRNVAENGLQNVTVNECAVSDQPSGQLRLFVRSGATNSGWASVAQSAKRETRPIEVATTTLDEYVARAGVGHVKLVKMDIEGAEPLALRGAEKLLSAPDAPDVLVEVNPFLLGQAGSSPAALARALADYGYRLAEVTARGLEPRSPDQAPTRLTNLLASKRGLPGQ